MKEKLYNILDRDELILHKAGLVVGALLGAAVGLFISDRADQFLIVEEGVEEDDES